MNRYKSSSKFNHNFDNQIIFEDDFDYQCQHNHQNQPKINKPSKAALLHNLEQTIQHINPNNVQQLNIIQKDPSSQEIRLNNFFGSKKILERKINNDNKDLSPQYNPQARQRRQIRTSIQENTNDKLKEMIQKQIQQRQRWQQNAQQIQKTQRHNNAKNNQHQNIDKNQNNLQTIESSENATLGTDPLLIINNQESFQRMNSKQKLTKINQQKFAAINLQKNVLFQRNNNEDGQYIDPIIQTQEDKQKKQKQTAETQQKKKKKNLPQLRPLKQKQSTYQILNQLDLGSRPSESRLISIAENNSSFFINKQSTNKSPQRIFNQSKTRIIGIDIKNFLSFAQKSLPKQKYIEATLHRDRKCLNKAFFPLYTIQIDEVNALLAKKTMKGYDIILGNEENNIPFDKMPKIGSVKGNFVGSYYNIFGGQKQNEILATVFYSSQLKTQSSVRNVQLYVRSQQVSIDQIDYGLVYDRTTNLKTLYNIGQNKGKIRKYISKKPIYNKETGIFQLDFGANKVTMPSVKNVVLINSQNPKQKVLVFGKCGHDNFYLKIQHPLNPIVAMGYLMTSFNFKWVTQ